MSTPSISQPKGSSILHTPFRYSLFSDPYYRSSSSSSSAVKPCL